MLIAPSASSGWRSLPTGSSDIWQTFAKRNDSAASRAEFEEMLCKPCSVQDGEEDDWADTANISEYSFKTARSSDKWSGTSASSAYRRLDDAQWEATLRREASLRREAWLRPAFERARDGRWPAVKALGSEPSADGREAVTQDGVYVAPWLHA